MTRVNPSSNSEWGDRCTRYNCFWAINNIFFSRVCSVLDPTDFYGKNGFNLGMNILGSVPNLSKPITRFTKAQGRGTCSAVSISFSRRRSRSQR